MNLFTGNTFYLSSMLFGRHFSYPDLAAFLNKREVDKHSLFTPTYLCGQYAYYSATEMDEIGKKSSINKSVFKSQLKLLKELGVVFDQEMALKYALNFKRMLDNDLAELKWF